MGQPIVGMGRAGDGWLKWRPLSVFIALELGSRGVQGVQLTCWCIVHSVNAVLVRGGAVDTWTVTHSRLDLRLHLVGVSFGQNQ